MSKNITLFEGHEEYNEYYEEGMLKPNVSHCIEEKHIHYNPQDYKISGQFTIPSRLLNVIENDNGEPSVNSCYGLSQGVKEIVDGDNIIYQNRIVPENVIEMVEEISQTSSQEKTKILKETFGRIIIDEEEVDYVTLIQNNGWYQLEEGIHDVVYYLSFGSSFFTNKIMADEVFTGIPLEKMVMDSRVKSFSLDSFNGCALLDTTERYINRITSITNNGVKKEPIIIECEFEDEYLSRGYNVSNTNYFPIYDGKVGMHVCEFTDDGQ